MSTRNSPEGEGGRCFELTTNHPSSAERQEIWGLNLPGPPRAPGDLLREYLYFYVRENLLNGTETLVHGYIKTGQPIERQKRLGSKKILKKVLKLYFWEKHYSCQITPGFCEFIELKTQENSSYLGWENCETYLQVAFLFA
jgi:hypothetical protein